MCGCRWVAQRYLVAALGFIGLLLSVGFRTVFSLVLTHISTGSGNANASNAHDLLISCPVYGGYWDWQVDWSMSRIQWFQSVYFAGTLITQVPGGLLAARFSPKRVCGVMIFLSSVLFIILPVLAKQSYIFVYVIRGLQGLIEGGSVPALAGVISAWAPKTERTRLLNLAYAGAYLSPAVGFVATGMATCRISWSSIFYIYGGLGVVWFILWMTMVCETPADCPHMSGAEADLFTAQGCRVQRGGRAVAGAIPWRRMLTSLPVLAVFVGAFCRNWIFSMQITQQPIYFKDSFPLNTAEVGLILAISPVFMTIFVIGGGIFFDKMIEKQYIGRTIGRKLAQTLGFGTEGVCILCLYWINEWKPALSLLCVGIGLSGLAISGYQVNPLDLSPQYASVITGIGRIGTIGSVLSTAVAANLANHTLARWKDLWLAAGIIHLTGVVLFDLLASGHTQPWDPTQAAQEILVNGQRGAQEHDPLLRNPAVDREDWEHSLEDSLRLG